MSSNKEYDLIFSIGEACSCTSVLRALNLQQASYPFDWLFGSDFLGRCNILINDFDRFIEKNDLEYSYEERSISCVAYHNVFNDITFNHDFLKSVEFNAMYEDVKQKYERRIKRLLSKISEAQKFLIVYVEVPSSSHIRVENDEILKGYEILRQKFGNKVDLLYIKNEKCAKKVQTFDNVVIISLDYKAHNAQFDYEVKMDNLKKALEGYRLKMPFVYLVRLKLLKFFIKIIPGKKNRQYWRKKYHV